MKNLPISDKYIYTLNDRKEMEENIIFIKNRLGRKNYHDSSKAVDLVCELEDEKRKQMPVSKENSNIIEVYRLRAEEETSLTNKAQLFIYLPKIRKKLYNKDKLAELERLLLLLTGESLERLENLKGD